jgi:septal ring factor EnvC (AmiA/AmiB activator)
MKTTRFSPKSPFHKSPLPIVIAIVFCFGLFGSIDQHTHGIHSTAAAQEQVMPDRMRESYKEKLPQDKQQEIIKKSAKIRKLQEGIIDHKIKILGSKRKERSLLGDLERIENELKAQKKTLASLQVESEKQEELLADRQEYLKEVIKEKRAHQKHVKNRLAAYYRMGTVGLMNVLFSAETLPELMDFQEYFNLMLEYDQSVISKYLVQINELNLAREAHAREKLRLMTLANEVRDKEKQLVQIQQEKNLLLKQVNTEKHLYQQAVAEIEEAAADLALTLSKLQVQPEPIPPPAKKPITPLKQKKQPVNTTTEAAGFMGQKGSLDPPVFGTIITKFGQQIEGKFGSSTTSSGIDIKAKNGLEIKAVYDGKIIHAGYLRGYGNLVIIDHGQQHFSMTSRIADIYKKEGTRVKRDEIIGMTGEGDKLYGEGLHFEIRKGSKPEDPLLWLKKNSLPDKLAAPTSKKK